MSILKCHFGFLKAKFDRKLAGRLKRTGPRGSQMKRRLPAAIVSFDGLLPPQRGADGVLRLYQMVRIVRVICDGEQDTIDLAVELIADGRVIR